MDTWNEDSEKRALLLLALTIAFLLLWLFHPLTLFLFGVIAGLLGFLLRIKAKRIR